VVAWALWALAVAGCLVIPWLDQLLRRAGRPDLVQWDARPGVAAVITVTVGAVLASRRPAHPVGWLLLALELRRAMAPLSELLDRLTTQPQAPTGDRLSKRYREQRAHLQHLVEGAAGLGDRLSNVLQANLTLESVRQNDDMRQISAWVAIWAVPTLLAGIYGMNFRHMPELECSFGYPLVLVVMVVVCLGLYRAFRRSGWL
jgi:hypothetical protein